MEEVTDTFLEELQFYGHRNVLATHYNTLEITMDEEISKRADCIIGVKSNKGCLQLSEKLRNHIHQAGRLRFILSVSEFSFEFTGKGEPALDLNDPREIVFRKSNYVSSRTVALNCSVAACDIPRPIIKLLQNPESVGKLLISAIQPQFDAEET